MPSPPGMAGQGDLEGWPCSIGGSLLGPGVGTWAARAAEIPTRLANDNQSLQRLGNAKPDDRRKRREAPPETASPKGWPQRAQTMRPARPRSAFTAQLPQLGQAMRAAPTEHPTPS
jgi:hypothetical protein